MDEVTGEQVVAEHAVGRGRVNEDVGERRRGEAHVARPLEQAKQVADGLVDRRRLVGILFGVDGGIVRLVPLSQWRALALPIEPAVRRRFIGHGSAEDISVAVGAADDLDAGGNAVLRPPRRH